MKVSLVYGVISVCRDRIRIKRHRAPKVCQQAVCVIHGFAFGDVGALQQNSAAAEERFDIMLNVAQCRPHDRRDLGLSAKPHKRRLHEKTAGTEAPAQLAVREE